MCHLRPVIKRRSVGIFEMSDSNPIWGNCRRSLSPQKSTGLRRIHGAKTQKTQTQGCESGVFGNGVFVLCRKHVVLTKKTKNTKITICILPAKTRGCAPQSPENDENVENGGCPSDNPTVCQKRRFRHHDRQENVENAADWP